MDYLQIARETLGVEEKALGQLSEKLDGTFTEVVDLILNCKGRLVIGGIGKSGLVGKKMVATFASTGTPSFFLHPTEAFHGDLGMLKPIDVVMLISYSGETDDVNKLIPSLKNFGNKIIALTSNKNSTLARHADYVLDIRVEREVCPNNLAPTTSVVVTMALGDALAVCLLEMKHFGSSDFAKYHPGGALGKRLYLKVSDIVVHNQKPEVSPDTDIKKVIVEISAKMLGVAAVIDQGNIVGVVTDGDIRRMLSKTDTIKGLTAKDIMSVRPKTIDFDSLAIDALNLMEKNKITQLLVTQDGKYAGIIHLHNLIQEGLL